MAKLTLAKPTSGYNLSAINDNFTKIEAEFQDKVLYRANPVGENNVLQNNIDVNSFDLINIGNLKINGDLTISGVNFATVVAETKVNADNAAASEVGAGSSAGSASVSASAAAASALGVTTEVTNAIAALVPATIVRKTSDTGALIGPAGTTAQRPGSPVVGYTRFNTTLNIPEVWNNLAWVPMGGGATGEVKNKLINGNFGINQRGVTGTVVLAAGIYGHDRFKAGASGCTYTFATSNNVTTLTISAGSLIQVIEGLNLYSGTYALSWTGTAQGKIGAGSYSGSGVTGSVTGGTNLNIEFGTGTLSLVQFEPGTEVSPFERRDYGRELMMAQRYYQFVGGTASGFPLLQGYTTSGTTLAAPLSFPVVMRASPTSIVITGTWALSNATNLRADFSSPQGFTLRADAVATGTMNAFPNSTDDAITFSAEL